jgi:hypothetical protein
VAIKALASKLSKACFFILRDQTEFDPSKIFGGKNGCGREPALGLVETTQV